MKFSVSLYCMLSYLFSNRWRVWGFEDPVLATGARLLLFRRRHTKLTATTVFITRLNIWCSSSYSVFQQLILRTSECLDSDSTKHGFIIVHPLFPLSVQNQTFPLIRRRWSSGKINYIDVERNCSHSAFKEIFMGCNKKHVVGN